MKSVELHAYLARVAERKAALGLVDTEEWTASLRNSGENRTEEKRELLRRIGARAVAAGRPPIVSRY